SFQPVLSYELLYFFRLIRAGHMSHAPITVWVACDQEGAISPRVMHEFAFENDPLAELGIFDEDGNGVIGNGELAKCSIGKPAMAEMPASFRQTLEQSTEVLRPAEVRVAYIRPVRCRFLVTYFCKHSRAGDRTAHPLLFDDVFHDSTVHDQGYLSHRVRAL